MNPSEVSHGALINIVQKGLLYLDIEREVKGLPKVRHTLTHMSSEVWSLKDQVDGDGLLR